MYGVPITMLRGRGTARKNSFLSALSGCQYSILVSPLMESVSHFHICRRKFFCDLTLSVKIEHVSEPAEVVDVIVH